METVFDKPLDKSLAGIDNRFCKILTATTDFNNITEEGLFNVSWVSGGTAYHRPSNEGGCLVNTVSYYGDGTNPSKQQLFYTYEGNLYTRGFVDHGWTSWTKMRGIVIDTFATNASGATDMPVATYVPLFAYLSGYVLVPYYPPNASNWHIRDVSTSAPLASKTVTICYIKR